MIKERKDNKGRVLLRGESQIKNGSYTFRYVDAEGVRRSISNWKLLPGDQGPDTDTEPECLRDVETRILVARRRRPRKFPPKTANTLNAFWEEYLSMKCEIAETTLVKYIYLYNKHVRNELGQRPIYTIRYTDVKRFYISKLRHGWGISSLTGLHNLLNPIFRLALKEGCIDMNPAEGVLQEFRKRKDWAATHREALTEKEQEKLVDYTAGSLNYRDFLPMLTVFLGTGMRSGELAGLTWKDIDFEKNLIHVNHTMNYTTALNGSCDFIITTPKTKNAIRDIPMLSEVRQTFEELYARRYDFNSENQVTIDGYTDFIFRDLYGGVYSNSRLNRRLKQLVRDYNREEEEKAQRENRDPVPLPNITCHNLRHTFCTQMILRGIDLKSCQLIMGHAYVETTMRVYANITKTQAQEEMLKLEGKIKLR